MKMLLGGDAQGESAKDIRAVKSLLVGVFCFLLVFSVALVDAQTARASRCFEGAGDRPGSWPQADATVCFGSHTILRELTNDEGMGVAYTDDKNPDEVKTVVRPLRNVTEGYAVAFLPEAQACVLLVSDETARRHDNDQVELVQWLLDFLGPVREFVRQDAHNDCLVEMHSTEDNIDFAVVDFVDGSRLNSDAARGGILALRGSASAVSIWKIYYMEHFSRDEFSNLRWEIPALGGWLYEYLIADNRARKLLTLGRRGFVIERTPGEQLVVFLRDEGTNVSELRVCNRDELEKRSRSGSEALKGMLELTEREIAIRALLGGGTTIDFAAYVFCEFRGR